MASDKAKAAALAVLSFNCCQWVVFTHVKRTSVIARSSRRALSSHLRQPPRLEPTPFTGKKNRCCSRGREMFDGPVNGGVKEKSPHGMLALGEARYIDLDPKHPHGHRQQLFSCESNKLSLNVYLTIQTRRHPYACAPLASFNVATASFASVWSTRSEPYRVNCKPLWAHGLYQFLLAYPQKIN